MELSRAVRGAPQIASDHICSYSKVKHKDLDSDVTLFGRVEKEENFLGLL